MVELRVLPVILQTCRFHPSLILPTRQYFSSVHPLTQPHSPCIRNYLHAKIDFEIEILLEIRRVLVMANVQQTRNDTVTEKRLVYEQIPRHVHSFTSSCSTTI